MEVILREHVDHLGRRGDLVKVADGYARNYLLPRKLALLATEATRSRSSASARSSRSRSSRSRRSAQAVADRMANVEIEISRKVGETEALYGSVTSADIADALAAKGSNSIAGSCSCRTRSSGSASTKCRVKLHRDVTVKLKVRVVAEGERRRRSGVGRRGLRNSGVGAVRPEFLVSDLVPRGSRSSLPASLHFRCQTPPSPNARFRTISKPNARSSARSCCTTTRSTWPPKSSTPAISSATPTGASSTRWSSCRSAATRSIWSR